MNERTVSVIQRKADQHRKIADNSTVDSVKLKNYSKAEAHEDVLHTIKIFETFEGK